MEMNVLYYYQTLFSFNEVIDTIDTNEFIIESPLLASINKAVINAEIKSRIRPIELQQSRLLSLIKYADNLGINIANIEFTNELDEDTQEDIDSLLLNNDYTKLTYLVESINGLHDILSISYRVGLNAFKITKYAVAEIPATKEELRPLALSLPIEIAIGLKNPPIERV